MFPVGVAVLTAAVLLNFEEYGGRNHRAETECKDFVAFLPVFSHRNIVVTLASLQRPSASSGVFLRVTRNMLHDVELRFCL